jgi:hypothetical protein
MSLDEFRVWERKCLSEAVTNAARLRSRHSAGAATSTPSPEHPASDKTGSARSTDQAAPSKQKG